MERITSLKNPRVLGWRSLKDRKGRRETGCFLVEGRKMVAEALASGFPVEAVLADEARLHELALPRGVAVYALPEHVLAAVCDTKTPQGVAAVVRITEPGHQGRRLAVLDGVQDPGNVGTIIRTADAAGFDGVLLSGQCADVYSPKVLRATMGSVFRMNLRVTDDLPGALAVLRAGGYAVLSSQLDGEPFDEAVPGIAEPFVLVIGSEGNGVSEPVRQLATHRVALPMRGGAESLNAAVAAGIMMYGLMRGK
ncbi:MAG: RNA methyltransferase [Christensenellaceae bacterium]|nr:RNA methyltransferase [Christensenellaceae bacterium]MCH5288198.1 RNA methyltransferase [Christensenellaceae bacterium]